MAADPPTLDPTIFDRNLAALHEADPSLAATVADLSRKTPPASPATTRDGGINLRVARPDGSTGWFGRTSIPRVRAEALLQRFDPGQANVLLPGVGEGSEAARLTRVLGRHRAIFVFEEHPDAVHLMLRLHDVAEPLAEGRLVFIVCPLAGLTATLVAWLEAHPGHLCPNRLMMWPWHTPAALAACRSAVETAYQQIELQRQNTLSAALTASPGTTENPDQSRDRKGAGEPVVALLALHARADIWSQVDGLTAGARMLGWHPIQLDVRTPADVHPLARARRLAAAAQGPPDFAVLLDLTRADLTGVLPESIPAVSWLGPHAPVNAETWTRLGPRDRALFAHPSLLARARATGLDRSRSDVCPPPCLAPVQEELPLDDSARPIDVAIVADLASVDPSHYGSQLPTVGEVFKAAVELLRRGIERNREDDVDACLTQAETRLKTRLEDPAARSEILHILKARIAPSLLWHATAQAITDKGLKVAVLGTNWPAIPGADVTARRTSAARQVAVFRTARIVLHADLTGLSTGTALLAAGCGAVVAARAHPSDTQAGGLHRLLKPGKEMVTFSRFAELQEVVSTLLRDAERRRGLALGAIARCRSDHTPARRLELLRTAATSCPGPLETQP